MLLPMFASGRARRGAAAWLLGGALAAALVMKARTQRVAEQLDRSQVLATCLIKGDAQYHSLEANRSWQYFTGVNVTRSGTVICNLNISVAPEYDPFAARVNPASSPPMPERRLLFRIDWLQVEERTRNEPMCGNMSSVSLKRSTERSDQLCSTQTDRYAWLDGWLTVTIYPLSQTSILRFEASFAVLLAINVCEDGRIGPATLAVDDVTYVYAPDAWYEALLQKNSKCKAYRNYTVVARAADASRLVRVTVLAAPSAASIGCRRLCVERRCFVLGDVNASFEATEPVTFVYAVVGLCPGVERTAGFTLKLESVLSPAPRLSSADGGLSEAGVIALVVALIVVVLIVVIIVVAVIVIRRCRHRDGGRGYSLAEPPSGVVSCQRSNEYVSVPSSCPDGSGLEIAAVASAEKEIAMVDNDLYA